MRGNPYIDVPIYDLNVVSGEVFLKELRTYRSLADKIRFLEDIAYRSAAGDDERRGVIIPPRDAIQYYALNPVRTVAGFARCMTAGVSDPLDKLEILHNFRRDCIAYQFEGEEEYEYPRVTLARALERCAGIKIIPLDQQHGSDCEDDSVLGAAMAVAIGCEFRLVTFGRTLYDPAHMSLLVGPPGSPDIAHVSWSMLDGEPVPAEGWTYSETSIAANFGERPYDAARRLGIIGGKSACRHDLSVAAGEYPSAS